MKHSLDTTSDDCPDSAEIKALIARECTLFLCRDFKAWAECILQEPRLVRLGACMGGVMDYTLGWEAQRETILKIFERFPEPNPDMAAQFQRKNWSIRADGAMAWVSFDQYGPRSCDPLVTAGLSHQIRVLERHDGAWKIAMLGHGDTSLEYFDHPAIRLDPDQTILWMNDAAKEALADHPALMTSGAYLRTRFAKDRAPLASALKAMADLTVMEFRPSIGRREEAHTQPLLLGGETGQGMHLIWISIIDQMLIVKFADRAAEKHLVERGVKLFALSEAQQRLAALLLEGLDTPAAAARLGVSLNTAKTHLQRLFDKTGQRSQNGLIRALLDLSAPP